MSLTEKTIDNTLDINAIDVIVSGNIDIEDATIQTATIDGTLSLSSGTLTAPSLTFTGDTNTGLFRFAADHMRFTTNGIYRMAISNTAISSTLPVYNSDGTASAPSITFATDPNCGLYRVSADTIGFTTNGVLRSSINTTDITNTLPIYEADGAVGTPSYTFSNDTNTGMYRIATDNIGFACGGALTLQLTTGDINCTQRVNLTDGAVATPSLTFVADNNTGLYRIGADNVGVSCGGVLSLDVNASRVITPVGTQSVPALAIGTSTYGLSLADGLTIISNGQHREQYLGPAISLTDNTNKNIVSMTWSASGAGSCIADYQIHVQDGANWQIECGQVRFTYINNSSVYQGSATKVSSSQELTSGTLTTTFSFTTGATSYLVVNANSSFATPTINYYAIYKCLNFTTQPAMDYFF